MPDAPWVQLLFDTFIFFPVADRDAGAEGREEGSVRLYAYQLTALRSAPHRRRVHPRTRPPVSITPRHTDNNPPAPLSSCTAILILTYSHNWHFIFFSVTSLLSEALISRRVVVLPYSGRLLYHWRFTLWKHVLVCFHSGRLSSVSYET